MELSGRCLCGFVKYRAGGEISSRVHCHCSQCRRAGGAVAATWVTVRLDCFAFTEGEPAIYKSSVQAERRFCPRCGGPLTFWSGKDPGVIDIAVGTLDKPGDDAVKPDHHVWTSSRLSWLRLDESLPAYPEGGPNSP